MSELAFGRRQGAKNIVERINAYFLYTLGMTIHPLQTLVGSGGFQQGVQPTKQNEAWYILYQAKGALANLLEQNLLPLMTCRQDAEALRNIIDGLEAKLSNFSGPEILLDFYEVSNLQRALSTFESVFQAELRIANTYSVSKKGAFDTHDIVLFGERAFPSEIVVKVPLAVPDLRAAMRCLAFDLPTSAGFHLHRANETVLGAYWDKVMDGAPRPTDRNMGTYLREMEKDKTNPKGSQKVRAALRDIKDMHRNPLIHPEHSLENAEDAISLYGAIAAVMKEMLKEIDGPEGDMAAIISALSSPAAAG